MAKQKSKARVSGSLSSTLRSIYPPMSGHPIESALREAYCRKWEQVEEMVEQARQVKPANEEEALALVAKLVRLVEESNELLRWSNQSSRPLSKGQVDLLSGTMLETGWPASEVLEVARQSLKRPRGRPADKRRSAIDAFELQLANPGRWTWRKLAKQAYGCKHEKSCDCGEHLRQEVIHLKRFLTRMHIRPAGRAPRK